MKICILITKHVTQIINKHNININESRELARGCCFFCSPSVSTQKNRLNLTFFILFLLVCMAWNLTLKFKFNFDISTTQPDTKNTHNYDFMRWKFGRFFCCLLPSFRAFYCCCVVSMFALLLCGVLNDMKATLQKYCLSFSKCELFRYTKLKIIIFLTFEIC